MVNCYIYTQTDREWREHHDGWAERICLQLNCQRRDIAEIIPDDSPDYGTVKCVELGNEVISKR
jgi:hypothetical protein